MVPYCSVLQVGHPVVLCRPCYVTYCLSQLWVLLQELDHTVSQLGLVLNQSLGLVQREQHLGQELLVLGFEREGKTVDDASQDLQQLGNTIELLGLVDESAG